MRRTARLLGSILLLSSLSGANLGIFGAPSGTGLGRRESRDLLLRSNPVRPQSTQISEPSQVGEPQTNAAPEVTVVLDPAHGGADFGARGPTGLAESDVVLDFARAARIALEAQRLRVLLTREGNQNPSFDRRSAIVNGLQNAIFVSLHVSSSGPAATARTYYYASPASGASGAQPVPQTSPPAAQAPSASGPHTTLVPWDRAQQPSVDLSRQLAAVLQSELSRRFKGSPEAPRAAAVRQLRTIAAPAVAIEVSSIDVTDAKRLEQMAQPLAEVIARAISEFHLPASLPFSAPGAH